MNFSYSVCFPEAFSLSSIVELASTEHTVRQVGSKMNVEGGLSIKVGCEGWLYFGCNALQWISGLSWVGGG